MSNYYSAGWGWIFWFGLSMLFFSSIGNWGYTYRAHQKYADGFPNKSALDILNERYARGQIKHEEYIRMKYEINASSAVTSIKSA